MFSLGQRSIQDYWLTQDAGDPNDKLEANQETETEPKADQELVLDTIEEVKEPLEDQAEAGSEERTQSRKEPAGSPPQADLGVERPIRSQEKEPEADLSQGPDFISPQRPAREQAAQGDYTKFRLLPRQGDGSWCRIGLPSKTIRVWNWHRYSKLDRSSAGQICSGRTWPGKTKSGTMWRGSWVVFPKPVWTAV
jgi:hypothetical protein